MATNSETPQLVFSNYVKRFFIHKLSQNVPLPDADAYVVIPCYAEEELSKTLESLKLNEPCQSKFCVLVVVNDKLTDNEDIKIQSKHNADFCIECSNSNHVFSFAWIDARNLEDKNAGVGLARKIGMDAVIIHNLATQKNAALICLDADCQVSAEYFLQLEKALIHSDSDVAVLEFEHLIPDNFDPQLANGISQYELFLEYYRLGLKLAGFPFWYHTVGSSMACTAVAYASQGGMNQRKAGEDFYFLHKLFPHYKTVEIAGPLVFPSPRISRRVPFGTGRFQEKWKESRDHIYYSYHPRVFSVLKEFIQACYQYLEAEQPVFEHLFSLFSSEHEKGTDFLYDFKVVQNLERVRKASPKIEQRKKAFFRWFDGLLALRLVHYFNAGYPKVSVGEGIKTLVPAIDAQDSDGDLKLKLREYLRGF